MEIDQDDSDSDASFTDTRKSERAEADMALLVPRTTFYKKEPREQKPEEKEEEQEPSGDFEVWEENWEAVMMFLRMQTQWQVSMSGYVGLKYEVLLGSGGLCDLYNVEDRRDVLERLQILEATALSELRKRSDGKAN